jgi:CDP-diacylglycerol---glycerol-3-phosphate 3-phosphatidyltransferase
VISEHIGAWIRTRILFIGRFLGNLGVTPNMLTIAGLLLNVGVAAVIAFWDIRIGGILLLFASAFDMLDGAVARATGKTSKFGGFLDSTLDRYSESIVYLGVLLYVVDTTDAKTGSILTLLATTGALLISYTRARAEAAGYHASVGLVARPERVILLAICLILKEPLWALWALAILTHLTAFTRIAHVWRLSQQDEAEAVPAQPAAAAPRVVSTNTNSKAAKTVKTAPAEETVQTSRRAQRRKSGTRR